MSRRQLKLVLWVAALAMCTAAGLSWYWVPIQKPRYVRANDRLIAGLRPFPGARVDTRRTRWYTHGCPTVVCLRPERTIGYESDVTYVLRRPVRASAVV